MLGNPRTRHPENALVRHPGWLRMSFSGIRAVVLIVVFVVLLLGISKFNFPGWVLPVGLIAAAVVLKSVKIGPSSA
jgi:hypothetical protein